MVDSLKQIMTINKGRELVKDSQQRRRVGLKNLRFMEHQDEN